MTTDEEAKAYEMALEAARKELGVDRKEWEVVEQVLKSIFPELAESEDERTKRMLNTITYKMSQHQPDIFTEEENEWLNAYLEKQKDASKAIEAVDRIDKYIDEHLANAHDMKDSNPDKKYYRGWDDALGKMAGILQDVYSWEKQKEPHYTKRNALFDKCVENCDPEVMKEVSNKVDEMLGKEQKPSIFPIGIGEVHWNPISSEQVKQRQLEWKLPDDFEEAVYKVANFITPFNSQEELRKVSHRFAEQLMSLAKKELDKPVEWSEEDSEMFNRCIMHLEQASVGMPLLIQPSMVEEANFLRRIKSLRPSWKPSEDEERLINTSISFLKDFADKGYENAVECIDWLKSKLNGNSGK